MTETDVSSPFHYSASETLVIFLDFHSLFVNFIGASDAASKAAELRSWAKSRNIPIAHALIDVAEDNDPPKNIKGYERTFDILNMMRKDNSGVPEPAGIKPDSDDEIIFTRRGGYVSALTSDKPHDVNGWLKEQGYKSLILCGLSSSGCVMRTATHATDMGFVVSVVEDACMDKEETHRVVMENILPMRAHVFKLDALQQGWEVKT